LLSNGSVVLAQYHCVTDEQTDRQNCYVRIAVSVAAMMTHDKNYYHNIIIVLLPKYLLLQMT